jgi:ribose-phosphate pyrophosphokinase
VNSPQLDPGALAVFALKGTRKFGEGVARNIGVALSSHEEREFEDGEHKIRPLENVRNRDVFVLHSLYSDPDQSVNDKLCRMLFFVGALRDASAGRVTAVVPYLAYARKDQKSQTRDPVTTRYVAQLFEAAGAHQLVTLEVHNLAAFQNAFRIPTDHLESRVLFAEHFARILQHENRVTVVSPDLGGTKRAEAFRSVLKDRIGREILSGFMEKTRALGAMSAGRLVGDVKDSTVIVFDDLISTGGTIVEAARRCKEVGAKKVFAAAAHGVFAGRAHEVLAGQELHGIVVSDSIPPFRVPNEFVQQRVTVLSAAPIFAEAIVRSHTGGSIVGLFSP